MVEPFPLAFPAEAPDPFIEDERRLIDRLIEERLVDISYQAIIDLQSRSIFAYEAFARPGDGYFRTPGDLIDAAVRARRMGKLGRHLRNLAIRGCQRWPIFINLNPHEFGDPFLVQPDEPVFVRERPVYLEISEGVPSDFFDQCHSVLSELRRKGVLLAIDDFGAGSSSLKTIVELQPDMVKIHRDLVIGCLPGSREFDLLRSITDLCHQMEAQVIAEGIETFDELKACIAAGIDYGQGFLLSVPHNPPPSFFWPPELIADSESCLKEFLKEKASQTDTPSADAAALSTQNAAALEQVLVSTRVTIRRLEDDLKEARQELAESTEECSTLSRRLKQLSLATEARTRAKPERRREPEPAVPEPLPTADVGLPQNPNEEDALHFLRKIEEERAQQADGDNS
jgi:EAL domain-containing protein (putative c-di-GMP-specific phosphodiesterase class I)